MLPSVTTCLLLLPALMFAMASAISVPTGKLTPISAPTPRPRRTVPSSTVAPAPVWEQPDDENNGQYRPSTYRPPNFSFLRPQSIKFRLLYQQQDGNSIDTQGDLEPVLDVDLVPVGSSKLERLKLAVQPPYIYYRRKMYYSGQPFYHY